MKKLIVTFFVLLLVPVLATASTNMVSITELRQQAENMGRWTQTYEAHGRTIEVDVPIIVPEVEKLPVVEVEAYYAIRNDRLNRENYPLKRLHTYDEKEEYKNYIIYEETNLDTYLNNEKQTTGELRIVNSETGLDMADLEARYDAPTEKLTIKTKYTSQSFYPYELKAEHIYAEDNPDSLQDAINVLNGVVDYFYPEGNGVYVDQVEVRSRARKVKGIDDYKLGECVEGYPMGTYRLSVRPKIEGVPIYIEISRRTRINQFESDDAYFKIWKKAERIMAINDMWFEYMNCNSFEFSGVWLKKKNIFAEDVPLVSLETVLSVLEDKIKSGNIRNVYALELGYCAYLNEESPESYTLYPIWFCECDYLDSAREEFAHSSIWDQEDSLHAKRIRNRYSYVPLLIHAQTGMMEDVWLTRSEQTYCPEVIIWGNTQ